MLSTELWTIIGVAVAAVGLIYTFIRNLKNDINERFETIIRNLKNDINERFETMDRKFDKVNERIDKLAEKVEDIDRRLCRIEGSLATQGHCLFTQNKSEIKKVE
jgi:predicted nuclease with TOPRIM domain